METTPGLLLAFGMALLSCQDLRIAFGSRPLLDDATLHIERGERIGLVGRNGEGKSTLLRILSGEIEPDAGTLVRESGVRVALLTQQVPASLPGTVDTVIRQGLDAHVSVAQADHHVQRLGSLLELDPNHDFDALSGGQKRRTLLARALAVEPDVLLLDEPTNHLDVQSIEWLEDFLLRWGGSLLFVTHDRTFLQSLSTRIVELDRGRLTSWACDYPTYLERKDEALAAEEKEWARLDRKLAQEEAWIRQGIKARRTRNEGRVRALERLRRERADRRQKVGEARIGIQAADRSGRKVIVADGVSWSWGDQPLIRDFSATIMRGDKIGMMGPNGAGKTTLVHLLLGQITPDAGTISHGTSLEIGYFDQHREELDGDQTVADNVGFGSDHVTVGGERRHVLSYLQDFLFSPDRARQPIRVLSGGERNRLLLARLFTRPSNLLVLDEPTNDLDAETLELLEARLVEFEGTVLVVSHDRRFLDNLCTGTFVFEGGGRVKEYVGGYTDWKRAVARRRAQERAAASEARPASGASGGSGGGRKRGREPGRNGPDSDRPRRLTWAERKEFEKLPDQIEALEAELEQLHATMADPDFFKGDPDDIRAATERIGDIEGEIERAMERWAALGERE